MTLLIILIVLICLLLVLVVLAQNSKGGGLSSQFGGGASQMIGVKRTSDLLEKVTWGLAIALLALSLMVNIVLSTSNPEGPVSPNIQRAEDAIVPLPGNGLEGLDAPAGANEGAEGATTPAATDSAQ